jgi:hypothetical protein
MDYRRLPDIPFFINPAIHQSIHPFFIRVHLHSSVVELRLSGSSRRSKTFCRPAVKIEEAEVLPSASSTCR